MYKAIWQVAILIPRSSLIPRHIDLVQHSGVKKSTWNFTFKYQNEGNNNI